MPRSPMKVRPDVPRPLNACRCIQTLSHTPECPFCGGARDKRGRPFGRKESSEKA